jgi:hypothetical protein
MDKRTLDDFECFLFFQNVIKFKNGRMNLLTKNFKTVKQEKSLNMVNILVTNTYTNKQEVF